MSDAAYDAFAARVVDGGLLLDPWLAGRPRLRDAPVFVTRADADEMARVAEGVAALHQELAALCEREPDLRRDFLGLSPYQELLWQAEGPRWHAVARADVFRTDRGLQITELNSDTPTGSPEAVALNSLAREAHPATIDPSSELEARVMDAFEAVARARLAPGSPRVAGIVYPTELTEDLSLVRLYRRWLLRRGWRVVLGAPANLSRAPGDHVTLFGEPVSLLVRHYKTDWWTERESAWTDVRIPSAAPLVEPVTAMVRAVVAGNVAVVNPLGAVVTQNKRLLALAWERRGELSGPARAVLDRHVPESARLEAMEPARLEAEQRGWVLKSDYGAEGDEVIVGAAVTDAVWRATLRAARPRRWIAQRYFHAEAYDDGGVVNYGVFVAGGRASGMYARVQRGPTDLEAVSAPLLVTP
ncbi:MAG: glutathionylspermidine synthase family protein [Polyangiaceae bacterium]|nr:glutathionylspermidine synthase family protein [Polyangiaceae bacterium]